MSKVKTGAVNPLPVVPIALVGANVNGKPNFMAVGFVNGVNIKPPIVYVSLNKNHHTLKGILEHGTFSINVPSADFVMETDYCGLVSGKNADKSRLFTTFYGELKTAPMIEEFPITCECRCTGQPVEFAMDVVYFGEVIQTYVNEELLSPNQKIDILKAHPIFYSGMENRYRALGGDLGPAWSIGRHYKPKGETTPAQTAESKYPCKLVDRAAQPALTIRSRVAPFALAAAIGKALMAIFQYAGEKGYAPTGAPFMANYGFNGGEFEIEVGFPFGPGVEGNDLIKAIQLPGGKAAIYRHVGPYEKLPEVHAALEQWLQANGHAIAGASYDFYLNDPQRTAPENLETEILYPLV